MPSSQRSLAITERYRAGMVGLRERAQKEARRTWRQIDPNDLDGTYRVGMLALTVSTLQREAARLSSAYLAAYIGSELGRPVRDPMVDARQVGSGRSGGDLKDALRAPVIDVKVAIRDGTTPKEALALSESRLERMVGLATDTAAREALRTGMKASPHVVGWKRAIRGTCGACMGAADGSTREPGESLDIHPNCQCVSEPVVKGAEERTLPPSIPADVPRFASVGEAEDWARQHLAASVDFGANAKLDVVQAAVDGIHDAIGGTAVRLEAIKVDKIGRKGVRGLFSPNPPTITFQPSFMRSSAVATRDAQRTADAFAAKRAREIASTEANIADKLERAGQLRGDVSSYVQQLKDRLSELKATKRWYVQQEDPIRNLARHEAAHALMHGTPGLASLWESALSRAGVRAIDRRAVSEYAATNGAELWAETVAAIKHGLRVPSAVREAYEETLKHVH